MQIVGCEAFQAFTSVEIRGENIRHNLTRTEGSGFVIVADPAGNVPVWLVSAMKTLANCKPISIVLCFQFLWMKLLVIPRVIIQITFRASWTKQ